MPGFVYQTESFHAHQDQEIPILGFIVLASKRHIQSIEELTEVEAVEFVSIVRQIRRALREELSIEKVYLVEEELSKHFHLWLFPHHDWMNDPKFGKRIASLRPVMDYAKENMKTPENIAAVLEAAEKLRQYLKGS